MTNEQHLKEIKKYIRKFKLNSLEEKIYRDGVSKGLEIARKIYNKE